MASADVMAITKWSIRSSKARRQWRADGLNVVADTAQQQLLTMPLQG
jgi:hypothetical protein